MESPFNRVLITGIQGFTGKFLQELLLSRGYAVYGISNAITEETDTNVNCDITNTSLLTTILERVSPNYIIHLAAISFVQHENPSEIYQVNILGTESLLEAIVKAKIKPKKVLLASSATIYGDQHVEVLSEDMQPNPKNHYGISKYGMEQIAKNYFSVLPIIIARPFNYTGVGQSLNFVIPKIVHHFKSKLPQIELGNINVYREFNDVDFVCNVYYRLMHSSVDSEIVNVCSGKVYSLQEVLKETAELSGHQLTVIQNPKFMRPNEVIRLTGSTDKLKTILNDLPETNLRKTLSGYFDLNTAI
jgi:nucleoside-diphosphate-sugar epimerase